MASDGKSSLRDGMSESSTDVYWGLIGNQSKALRNPNPDALRDHISDIMEGSESGGSESEGIFSKHEVLMASGASAPAVETIVNGAATVTASAPAAADTSSSSASSGSGSTGSSGSTASSSSSGSAESEEDVDNPVLSSLRKKSQAPQAVPAVGTAYPSVPIGSGKSLSKGMTAEQLRIAKLEILSKLTDLQNRGVVLSQDYNMNSDLDVMHREYNIHFSIRNKEVIVSMYDQGFTGTINISEFLNTTYDPFGFKLKGISNAVAAERDTYRDIWADFYELYHKNDQMVHPVARLAFALGNTLTNHHIANATAEAQELEKERINKQISEQVKLEMSKHRQQVPSSQPAVAGRPSYDDLARYNTELEKKVAYLNTNTTKVMQMLSDHERRMQQQTTQQPQRPAPQISTPHQQTQSQTHSYGGNSFLPRMGPQTAEARRLDDHLSRMSIQESRSRHSAMMDAQDRIIGGSHHSSRRHAREETEQTATEESESSSDDRRSRRRRHGSSSDDSSRSSRSSGRSTVSSRTSKGKKRSIKIDTEQIR